MNLSELYEADETAWLDRMVELLERGEHADLDFMNLKDCLESMANRDRRQVERRLTLLIEHLLKWEHQPARRGSSWRRTILVQRHDLARLLRGGSLRRHAERSLAGCYRDAVTWAASETCLPPETFPRDCPWSLEEALGSPGGPAPGAA